MVTGLTHPTPCQTPQQPVAAHYTGFHLLTVGRALFYPLCIYALIISLHLWSGLSPRALQMLLPVQNPYRVPSAVLLSSTSADIA